MSWQLTCHLTQLPSVFILINGWMQFQSPSSHWRLHWAQLPWWCSVELTTLLCVGDSWPTIRGIRMDIVLALKWRVHTQAVYQSSSHSQSSPPFPSSIEFNEPIDPIDLYLEWFFEKVLDLALLLRVPRGGLAKPASEWLIFSCWPLSLQLSSSSPIVSQPALLEERGSHKKLLKLWLHGKAWMTCLIQLSISGQ